MLGHAQILMPFRHIYLTKQDLTEFSVKGPRHAMHKFHLQILNQSKCLSTDEDLMKILHVSIRNTLQMTEINDLDGVISRAVGMITVVLLRLF